MSADAKSAYVEVIGGVPTAVRDQVDGGERGDPVPLPTSVCYTTGIVRPLTPCLEPCWNMPRPGEAGISMESTDADEMWEAITAAMEQADRDF